MICFVLSPVPDSSLVSSTIRREREKARRKERRKEQRRSDRGEQRDSLFSCVLFLPLLFSLLSPSHGSYQRFFARNVMDFMREPTSPSLSLSVFVSVSVSLYLCISVSLYLCIAVSLYHCISLSLCLRLVFIRCV